MERYRIILLATISLMIFALAACKNAQAIIPCADGQMVLTNLTDADGTRFILTTDGKVYRAVGDGCEFVEQYFNPRFLEENYAVTDTVVSIKVGTDRFPTKNSFTDTFEKYSSFNDIFIMRPSDTAKFWNTMTLQSPLAPTVQDYVNLRTCIFQGTCSFRDNRIELAADPQNPRNRVLRFRSVAPGVGMITSKSSIESTITFFRKGENVWFEGKYLIASSQLPYSLVDFENQWFNLSPGPRLVIIDGALAIENKFGLKVMYKQQRSPTLQLPRGQWVNIKVHIGYNNDNTGVVEVWQDGVRIIAASGVTLPTPNSIQTNLEVGITATDNAAEVLVDDIRLSSKPF